MRNSRRSSAGVANRSRTARERREPFTKRSRTGSLLERGPKGVPRKGVWTSVKVKVRTCKELRVKHDQTSCYLRVPFLGTPLSSLQTPLYYTILYYTIPYYTILYHTIPYYTILYHTIPYYTILYHTIPYYTILYHTIPYSTILYHTLPYYTISYYTIPYHTIPYHTIICHTTPYYTISYYTIPYHTIL